jgi:hypothetical protein
MKFRPIRPSFSKVHLFHAAFISVNIITAMIMEFTKGHHVFEIVHFYSGLMIFTAPIIIIKLMDSRRNPWKSFIKLIIPSKWDYRRIGSLGVFTKMTATILLFQVYIFFVTGLSMKFLSSSLGPIAHDIHVANFKTALVIAPLHIAIAIAKSTKRRKRVKL